MDRRLVDHLVNSSIVSRAAAQRMILRASKDKTTIVDQLFGDDKIDEDAVAKELASYYGLDVVVPARFSVNDTALKFISKSMADKHGVLPFAVSAAADHVTVAVYNPESAQSVVESLKTATGKEPTVQVAPRSWLHQAIRHFYFGDPWADAPAHRATTREVTADAADLSVPLGQEESSEIVLDEVVVPPVPKPRATRKTSDAGSTPVPVQPSPEPQPKPKAAPPEPPRKRRQSRSGIEADSEVDHALDEFDAFLDNATGWGNHSGASGIPGWDEEAPDVDPFSMQAAAAGWEEPAAPASNGGSGFSLFDDAEEPINNWQSLVQEHEETIEKLKRELQNQRDIISALVDALADAGVVSKRDIKHRVKRK